MKDTHHHNCDNMHLLQLASIWLEACSLQLSQYGDAVTAEVKLLEV